MKAIICGTGVAGLALAVRLGRAGWDVLLLERDPHAPKAGYLIDVSGPGYSAAQRLDLVLRLEKVSYDIPEVVWLDQCGAPVARLHHASIERAMGGQLLTLMRSDLEHALFTSLVRTTEIRYGNTIEDIDLRRDCVRVRLTDGSSESADLLVGADGVHSKVREVLLGDTEFAFRSLGLHTASFVFEDADVHAMLAGRLAMMSIPGRQASFYPLRQPGVTAAYFAHRMPDPAVLTAAPADLLSDLYKSFGWVVPAALQYARSRSDLFYDTIGQIELSRWSFGRVALLGDACQASSLVAGRGASLALHAACVLADQLDSKGPIAGALQRYEQHLKPTILQTQERRRRTARWFLPSSWIRLGVRNTAIRLLDHRSLSWLLRPMLA